MKTEVLVLVCFLAVSCMADTRTTLTDVEASNAVENVNSLQPLKRNRRLIGLGGIGGVGIVGGIGIVGGGIKGFGAPGANFLKQNIQISESDFTRDDY